VKDTENMVLERKRYRKYGSWKWSWVRGHCGQWIFN